VCSFCTVTNNRAKRIIQDKDEKEEKEEEKEENKEEEKEDDNNKE
jgi:hypothetical protein